VLRACPSRPHLDPSCLSEAATKHASQGLWPCKPLRGATSTVACAASTVSHSTQVSTCTMACKMGLELLTCLHIPGPINNEARRHIAHSLAPKASGREPCGNSRSTAPPPAAASGLLSSTVFTLPPIHTTSTVRAGGSVSLLTAQTGSFLAGSEYHHCGVLRNASAERREPSTQISAVSEI